MIGVWQRNFEPVVCVYGTTVRRTAHTHTHTPLVQNYAAKHRSYDPKHVGVSFNFMSFKIFIQRRI